MNITELVKRATVKKELRRYEGDDVQALSFRVPSDMMEDIDAVAGYLGISRAQTMRSMLSEKLPELIKLCEQQGPNVDGETIDSHRIQYGDPPELSDVEQRVLDEALEERARRQFGGIASC